MSCSLQFTEAQPAKQLFMRGNLVSVLLWKKANTSYTKPETWSDPGTAPVKQAAAFRMDWRWII